MMDYHSYIDQVIKLPFINDRQAADSAIKAVLGVLASKVGVEEARRLTNTLPPEINYSVLRGHQQRPVHLSMEQFIAYVAKEFHLDLQQAKDLVFRVFHCVKESQSGAEVMDELQTTLPADWADVVDRA